MKTIILPGYSEHNLEWADGVAKELSINGLQTTVHHWLHWPTAQRASGLWRKDTQEELNITSGSMAKARMSLKTELERIRQEIDSEKINIIAKSVGVYVALKLVPRINDQINKIVLCGIASVASNDRADLVKILTTTVSVDNILCIQNENDVFVTFAQAEMFYHSVIPKLKVISKPRSDHNYPYPDDFIKFLK